MVVSRRITAADEEVSLRLEMFALSYDEYEKLKIIF